MTERWPVEVASGSAEVIASGSVISFSGSPVSITFGPPEERLRLSFEFGESAPGQDLDVEQLVEGKHLRLVLTNTADPLGSGTAHPIKMGTLANKRLLLNFRVYALRDADRTIVYTLYAEPGLAGGIREILESAYGSTPP